MDCAPGCRLNWWTIGAWPMHGSVLRDMYAGI
jgi:hypothetical protein